METVTIMVTSIDIDSRFWNNQYTRRIFKLAAERVKQDVRPKSWEAFAATAVEKEKPEQVAEQLAMSVDSVYVAKSRVFTRLHAQLNGFDER